MITPTFRIFDTDCYCREFSATVLSVQPTADGNFAVALDRSAFFPEAGGQLADEGTLDGIPVTDVRENEDGVLAHILPAPPAIGSTVKGVLDWDVRYRRMQNHTGEHILSGIAFRTLGLHNVGFHLGRADMTVDFDGVLSREQLNDLEDAANRAIVQMHPVRITFPSPAELEHLHYRSKIERTEGIRIVTIEDCDVCACCAPHVANTGEIGLLKILDAMHYKGGSRLHLLCGKDALDDYRFRYDAVASLSASLSVKQKDVCDGVLRLRKELDDTRKRLSGVLRDLIPCRAATAVPENGIICLFEDTDDMLFARNLVNACLPKCDRLCAVFAGNDEKGYRYIIASSTLNLKELSPHLNATLCGRGGGSSAMIQGSVNIDRFHILDYFSSL